MFANLPLIRSRIATLLLGVCLLGMQGLVTRSTPFERVEEDDASWNGRPLPRPDSPGEAMAFRLRQWRDENGVYPANALVGAKAHVDRMRQRVHTGQLSSAAGVTNAGWTWLGPGNIGGRVRSLVIDPTNVNVMLAGSVGGGIFKTTNGGASWAPVDDFMANLAVSALVMQPGAPATIYAGTGEGFFNGDGLRGAGVFKTTDSGTTWQHLAATNNSDWFYVNRLAVSPDGLAIVAATRTGIYRSTNGGSNWTRRLVSDAYGITDLDFHPTDSNRAVASGYTGNAYYSIDGGMTWLAATGLAAATFRRVEIAYARSNPTIVYASEDVEFRHDLQEHRRRRQLYAPSPIPRSTISADRAGTTMRSGSIRPTRTSRRRRHRPVEEHRRRRLRQPDQQVAGRAASAHADHHAIVAHPGFNGVDEQDRLLRQRRRRLQRHRRQYRRRRRRPVHEWMDRAQQQPGRHAVLRRRRERDDRRDPRRHAGQRHAQVHARHRHDMDDRVRWRRRLLGRRSDEREPPVRRVRQAAAAPQPRRRRERRLDQRPVLERLDVCLQAGPLHDRRFLRQLSGEFHRALRARSEQFEHVARRRRVAVADDRCVDAEYPVGRARVGQHQGSRRR